jgi:hypothetical protein
MKIRTAQYIAKKQNGSYAVSAYRYQESFDSRSFQKGDLYCLLSLESEEDIQASTLLKFVWDGILDTYMYSEAKTANEAIMESLKMGEKKVRDLIRNDKSLEESGVDLNFALVANKKDGFYIGVYGNMEVFVYREGSFVCISEVLKKNNAKTAGVILKKDEFLAISTPELFSAFVENFDNNAGVDAIEESLKSIEPSLEGLEGILTLRVEEDVKVKIDDIEVKNEENLPKEEVIEEESVQTEKEDGQRNLLKEITLNGKESIVFVKVKDALKKFKAFIIGIMKKISPFFLSIREKISGILSKNKVFKKVNSRMSEIRFRKKDEKIQGFRIDGYKQRNLKAQRIKIVAVILICITSIYLLTNLIITKKHEREIHEAVTEQMNTAENYLSDAEEDIVKDKSQAETSLYSAKQILDSLSEEISEEDSDRRDVLMSEYTDLEDTLLNRKAVSEEDSSLVQFIDTRLKFGDDSSPTDIILYTDDSQNEYLYISDAGNGAVFRVSTYDKSFSKVPDESGLLKTPKYIDYGYDGVYVYDSTQGVLEAPFSDGFNTSFESLTGVKLRDLDDDSISEIAILTESDNIYLLSNGEKAIIKSSKTGSGYGLTYSYVESDTFANAGDFFSDFTIYVLRPGTDGLETYIYSYIDLKYAYSPLTLTGLRTDFENLTKGYTSGSLDFGLYVFDATQKRFVKFEKPDEDRHTGELVLKNQYIYRGDEDNVFTDVKDFVVDPNEEYMYVLDGKTVWRVTL